MVYGTTTSSAFLMEYVVYLINPEYISISGLNGNSSALARILRSPHLRAVIIILPDWNSLNGALWRGSCAARLTMNHGNPGM